MGSLRHLRVDAAALGASGVVAQAVSLAVLPALTWLYLPAEVGIAQTFTTVLGLLTVAAAGKMEQVVAVSAEAEQASAVIAGVVTSVALGVIIAMCIACYSGLSTWPWHESYWWLAPAIPVIAAAQLAQAVATRRAAFRHLARVRVEQSVIGAFVILVFGLFHPTAWALITAQILQSAAGATRLFRRAAPDLTIKTLWAARRDGIRRLYDNRAVLRAAVASGLVNNLAWSLPVFFVGFYYGVVEVGLLAIAMKCYTPVRTLITSTSDQIALSEGARLIERGDATGLRRQTMAMLRLSASLGAAVAVGALLAPAGSALLPGTWSGAVRYMLPLGLVVAMQVAVNPLTCLVVLFRQQARQIGYDVTRAVLVATVFTLCGTAALPAPHAMLAYAAGMGLMYAVYARFFLTLLPR